MSDAGKSQEPSMEEILASIRRMIAEDGLDLPALPPTRAAVVAAVARAVDDGRALEPAPLLSPDVDTAVGEAFGRLATTGQPADSRPVDQIVEDMLRPMLRAWLDDNLPRMVERLVREEIERVSRGRR